RRGSSSSPCRGVPGRRPGSRTPWPGSSAKDDDADGLANSRTVQRAQLISCSATPVSDRAHWPLSTGCNRGWNVQRESGAGDRPLCEQRLSGQVMAQRDNWGWQARIGMFIVGSEVVPEAEWWAMVPLNVSVHAARVTARAPWARWRDDRSGVELEDDLLRGCRQFAPMCLSAVVVGHSSSSIRGGPKWDEVVVETLSRELGGGVAATTNGLDCAAALQASGVNRPFLVFPPWFDDSLMAAGVRD